MANFPTLTNRRVMGFPISLSSSVSAPPMTAVCREQYRSELLDDLRNLSRTVNYRICTGAMCGYIAGAPNSGLPLDESSALNRHRVFVAIDTDALTDSISFDFVSSTVSKQGWNLYTAVSPVFSTTSEAADTIIIIVFILRQFTLGFVKFLSLSLLLGYYYRYTMRVQLIVYTG